MPIVGVHHVAPHRTIHPWNLYADMVMLSRALPPSSCPRVESKPRLNRATVHITFFEYFICIRENSNKGMIINSRQRLSCYPAPHGDGPSLALVCGTALQHRRALPFYSGTPLYQLGWRSTATLVGQRRKHPMVRSITSIYRSEEPLSFQCILAPALQ